MSESSTVIFGRCAPRIATVTSSNPPANVIRTTCSTM